MRDFSFEVKKTDKHSKARSGIIHTSHGEIKTPAFVAVGTQASVKALSNEDLKGAGSQVFFVNTYHLYLRPGVEVVEKAGGLHQFIGWDGPLMTDSAGFQVFSLAQGKRKTARIEGLEKDLPLVRISDDGVAFRSHIDGSKHIFTPELSIESQVKLGADIMIAFDECTFYPATLEYSRQAMERTHRWAVRSLKAAENRRLGQALYGSVQGGVYEDLRKTSAKFLSKLSFDGLAVGGVSVGETKNEMKSVLEWVLPCFPFSLPRHLLGVGEIDDIFTLVEHGIDSFDCVMPTRLGRMGTVLIKPENRGKGKITKKWNQKDFLLDLTKKDLIFDFKPIEKTCECFVCKNYSRAYLNHLFRTRELLAYRLATYHNLFFVEKLTEAIRHSIEDGSFCKLKKEWLGC